MKTINASQRIARRILSMVWPELHFVIRYVFFRIERPCSKRTPHTRYGRFNGQQGSLAPPSIETGDGGGQSDKTQCANYKPFRLDKVYRIINDISMQPRAMSLEPFELRVTNCVSVRAGKTIRRRVWLGRAVIGAGVSSTVLPGKEK